MKRTDRPKLGPLEQAVMQFVWGRPTTTADQLRSGLRPAQDLKESTVRTTLSRLEQKGFLQHDVEGRTYVYRPAVEPQSVATQQVRSIVERLCSGSVENLLVGLVDDQLITPNKLRKLADRIDDANSAKSKQKPAK
jgi:BlaI family transcriptional regulator, penicillinase repressor